MTAIVAISENDKVYMGGDSAGVGGLSISIRRQPKVFINGPFIIGYTTSFRMGQILQYNLDVKTMFTPPKDVLKLVVKDYMKFMVTRFVPEIKKAFKKGGYQRTNNSVDSCGEFLVGFKGNIFNIQDDYQVSQIEDNYDVCGCASDIMLGSLNSTSEKGPVERINLALWSAEKYSAGVCEPFSVLIKE
jgi:hypothetical protein